MKHRIAHLLLDSHGTIRHASPGSTGLLGTDAEKLVGMHVDTVLGMPTHCGCGPVSAFGKHGPHAHPVRAMLVEGSARPLQMEVEPLQGRPPRRMVSLEEDLVDGSRDPDGASDVHRLRRELDLQREFNAEMLANAPDGICIATPQAILFQNRAFEHLVGPVATPTELSERIRSVDGRSLEWFTLARREEDWLVPVDCVAERDGERREVQVYVRTIRFDDQPAIVHAVRDVSHLRTLERQLLRTRKLEVLGRIAAGVTHEVGNLLTLLAFDLEHVRANPLAATRTSVLDDLGRTTEKAQQLVRGLLRFTREPDDSEPQVDLTRSIRSLQPLIERTVGHGRELRFDLAKGPLVAPLDSLQVEQLILNLLLNARDATSDGDAIHLSLRAVNGGRLAQLSVRDFGVGMSQGVRKRAFEPLFTTKRDSEGAGLGLSIVREVVVRAGGTIWVESEPDQGALFVAELPLVPPAQAEAGYGERVHGDETIALCHLGSKLSEAMARSLGLLGYRVVECEECLGVGSSLAGPVDAWITGEEQLTAMMTCTTLRREGPTAPVLCVTRSSHPSPDITTHERCVKMLAKPFTPLDLARALRNALG